MPRRSNEARLGFSLLVHCCLFCWPVVAWGTISTDDGNKIFWGWWSQQQNTTTSTLPTTNSNGGGNNLADEGYWETTTQDRTTTSAGSTTTTADATTTTADSVTTTDDGTTTTAHSTTTTELAPTTTKLSQVFTVTESLTTTTNEMITTTELITTTEPPASSETTTWPTSTTHQLTTTDQVTTSDTTTTSQASCSPRPKFNVYWNVPSFQCHKYGLNFSSVSASWGIRQNPGDEFRGEMLAILYDPGEFPALLPAAGESRVTRNGGVPQEGDLARHLTLFAQHVDKLMPDPRFNGLGIIDFEHWRPIWRQNWGSLAPYRDFSRHIERRRHPYWFSSIIESEAIFRFQMASRAFMLETLRMAKRLRPFAKWGYYGYPFCFNYTPNNNKPTCSEETRRDNDGMSWLFNEETSHFPSLYLKEQDMYPWKRRRFVDGRLSESMRVARKIPVYPYVWYKYHDTNKFLTQEDMKNVLRLPLNRGCRGVVIWGASRDVNTRTKCHALAEYLEKVLGPAVLEVTADGWRDRQDESTTGSAEEEEAVLGTEDQDYHENVPYVH